MGSAMAQVLFGLERPTVGLLNIGVEEAKGLEEVREAGRILREGHWPQIDYSVRRGRRHRQGDGGRGGDRRICRQYRAQGRRGHRPPAQPDPQAGDEPHVRDQARLSAGAQRLPRARRQDGSAQVERRRLPRPQRHRHQEPRRHRCRRFRLRGRSRLRHGASRLAGQDRPGAGRHEGDAAPPRLVSGRPRDSAAVRRARLRQLSAEPGPHQRRAVADGGHLRRMDHAAHRHPRAPYRGGRRDHLGHGIEGRAGRAGGGRPGRAIDRPDRAGDLDAGQHLSGERGVRAGRAGHHPWRRLRSAGGLLRLRVRPGDRRRPVEDRRAQARW